MTAAHRLLAVDDQPAHLSLLKQVLTPAGYDVLEARSGGEALAVVQENLPDLILLDMHLPDMHGLEVLRRLRAVVVEVLLATPRVRELLRQADLAGIRSVLQSPAGIQEGMQTFDYAIYQLIQAGLVDEPTALAAAESPNDLRLRLRGLR